METQHTKGEWLIDNIMAEEKRKHTFWYYINDDLGNHIAEVKGRHCGIKNTIADANAKLIVVAPEMLKEMIIFCERVEKGEVRSKKTYARFKELIKKATK